MASWGGMLEKTPVAVRNGNVELAAHVIRKEGEKCNMLYGQLSKFHLEALLKNGQKVQRSAKRFYLGYLTQLSAPTLRSGSSNFGKAS